MSEKYLVVDFAECTYSLKTLSDNEIAEMEAAVIRINDGKFEENLAASRVMDQDDNALDVKLLWAPVDATAAECAELVKKFRHP